MCKTIRLSWADERLKINIWSLLLLLLVVFIIIIIIIIITFVLLFHFKVPNKARDLRGTLKMKWT